MNDLKFSSIKELEFFFKTGKFKKIFVICGEKSFQESGAKKILVNLLHGCLVRYFFKKSPYPELNELKLIIGDLKRFAPDLIVAIGGGSVLDYAKIANCLAKNEDLRDKIKNSSYKTFSYSNYSWFWS